MEFRFVPPDLHQLDQLSADLVACSAFEDKRPMAGLAGLLDWRLAGRVSELLRTQFAGGAAGEALLVTGRPRLPFDKLLVLGLGPRSEFNDARFLAALDRLVTCAQGLRIKKLVVELPGRGDDLFSPAHAADLLVEQLRDPFACDGWTLVEPPEAAKVFADQAREASRRVRLVAS